MKNIGILAFVTLFIVACSSSGPKMVPVVAQQKMLKSDPRTSHCPGLGEPKCRSNWESLELGMSQDAVKALLGSPKSAYGNGKGGSWKYGIKRAGGYMEVSFDYKNGRLSGWSKPDDQDYAYFLPPIANTLPATVIEPCPGIGIATCKSNWDLIRQGISKLQAEALLGKPESIENVKIGRDKASETWKYPSGGSLGMINGIVTEFIRPTSYLYHAPIPVIETGTPSKAKEQNI